MEKWLGRKCACKARRDKLDRLSQWLHAKLRGEDPEDIPGLIESSTGEGNQQPPVAPPPE